MELDLGQYGRKATEREKIPEVMGMELHGNNSLGYQESGSHKTVS